MAEGSPNKKLVPRIAKGIINGVMAGIEDENLKEEIEECSESEGSHIIEILKNHTPLLKLSQTSTPTLLSYWMLFLRLYGRDSIKCTAWDTFLLQRVGSVNLQVNSSLFPLLKAIVRVDNEIAQKLFEIYFRSQRLPLVEKVLTYYSTQKPKIFFQALAEYIKNPQYTLQAFRLLTNVASKQGAHVDMIVETKCMKNLIKLLQATTDLTLLGIGVMNITMILPVIPTHIPSTLPELFGIIRNVLSFPSLPSSVLKQVQWFLQHLYGMFPVMSINLLKDLQRNNAQLITKLEPILSHLRFNVGMLSLLEEELDVNRWKNIEPHQIVTECVQDDYLRFFDSVQQEDYSIESLYEQTTIEVPRNNDLSALSIEGQKILKLQDLIEEKILLSPSKHDEELIFSKEQLESRFILLRNELLFERYLQKQYLRRLRKFQAPCIVKHIEEKPVVELAVLEELKAKNNSRNQKLHQLENQFSVWESQLMKEMKELQEKFNKLEQSHFDLEICFEKAEEKINELTEELNAKKFSSFDLEMELLTVQRDYNDSFEPYKECALNISKNISMWEQNYQRACDNAKSSTDLNELLEDREDTISLLQAKIDADSQKMSILSEQVRKSKETISEMKEAQEVKMKDIVKLQGILVQQGDIATQRIKVIEEKYQTLRRINLALEKRCGQLSETITRNLRECK